jgi:Ni2+-binding GTPase involved in maturation of urease and hydrogenase
LKLCLVSGFLGSGKTTAITTASKMLLREKVAVAIITNDQGVHLVDTAFTTSLNIPTTEIRSGCFCCNYSEFHSELQRLDRFSAPDIVFAEAVGSCADLVATVINPTLRFDPLSKITLSVFADGPLLLSTIEGRALFISENVQYIYKKQLEEASIIVVSKSDMLGQDDLVRIKLILEAEYPHKTLLFQNSTDETSTRKWVELINEKSGAGRFSSVDIDYSKYAEGEAALAWLDASVTIHAKRKAIKKGFDFICEMRDAISHSQLAIGHLKFFLQSGDWNHKISYTRHEQPDEERPTVSRLADHVSILINARVETGPGQLKEIFLQTVRKSQDVSCHLEVLNLDSFQPGYPKPTYRLSKP